MTPTSSTETIMRTRNRTTPPPTQPIPRGGDETGTPFTPFPTLTTRERQVALQLAIGNTNREIADDLDISIKTIDTHRLHILNKTGCRNNVELARLAIREGYVSL